jgi:hypothetical protein
MRLVITKQRESSFYDLEFFNYDNSLALGGTDTVLPTLSVAATIVRNYPTVNVVLNNVSLADRQHITQILGAKETR